MRGARVLACILTALLCSRAVAAQTADNVLLVVNERSDASKQIGDHYAQKRALAAEHVLRVAAPITDTVSRSDYETLIESPIAKWLEKYALQDQILFIVLTKGVPLRILGTEGLNGTIASVDSELTVLYRKMLGLRPNVLGQLPNPYYLDQRETATAKPFTRTDSDIYLVTRLDGYTVEDVVKLIDRAQSPTSEGRVVLDMKATVTDAGGDRWLIETAARLRNAGYESRVVLESTSGVAATSDLVIGYYSWGSNDPSNKLRRFGLTFANGAIGGMFVSTDGRTFTEPPETWFPGMRQPGALGTQSLAADLIRDGITGIAGHVAEPYLNATIRPQILFPVYLAGFNLAESFYMAMPFLSWQTVVVGDPLCSPFPRKTPRTEDGAKGLDPKTMLPALFSERRLNALTRGGLNREAVALALRAEGLIQSGNSKEAETLLIRAVELEPRLLGANLRLAVMYTEREDHDHAIERYRRVLVGDPTNLTALNNLAYAIAVNKQQPKEALTLAERALAVAPEPLVLDTLAWIRHLLGDDVIAAPLVERALAGAGDNVDVLVHAATIHAALRNFARASAELAKAEQLNPEISQRADIRALRDRLKNP
jgi:uncharacterized protein (TIGR03790 family)